MKNIFSYDKIEFRKKIAHNLKKLRKQKHLTQQKLSGLAGINRISLAETETGKKSMTLDTLYKIKNVLKVDFAKFFI